MRVLLDTHAVVWVLREPDRLSDRARAVIEDPGSVVVVSVVSLWEIVTKTTVGKMKIGQDVRSWLADEGIVELPVTGDHTRALADLPLHHRDPFDRMLVAQARHEGLTLVTADRRLEVYSVAVMRADGT
ncbi:type II toxin-antitoxin system VapC family toxin [Actinomycetospora sp.]|uniref:type II toxin-antitoxin system VapC family toxin n=1 Tax=Actinomycetospora sp. TaxID=1872135 RepID=UPI002F42C4DE